MTSVTRRAALAGLAAAPFAFGKKLQTVGVQLYTVRSIIEADPLAVLREIEKIGFREVEMVAGGLDKIYPAVKQTSLRPVSLHLPTPMFTKDRDKLPAALDDAKSKGFSYVVCPYVAQPDRGGPDVMKRLGEDLGKAGEMARKAGLRLCYHNHAFEFEPAGDKGTLLDVLLAASDPKTVGLELDIMWSQVAGVDPVSVLKKYKGRVDLMHLKNVAKDVEQRYNEGIPRNAFREVGNGVPDVAPVLKAATATGVRHFFVEQDQTPGNPLDSLRQSYGYLAKLNF